MNEKEKKENELNFWAVQPAFGFRLFWFPFIRKRKNEW